MKSQLHSIGTAIIKFMVHRPQASAGLPRLSARQQYREKSSLYPYLPSREEQRDWLEYLYSIQSP
ncbi:MAG: hypothetical protein WA883_04760 [Phormidesmis sp.]